MCVAINHMANAIPSGIVLVMNAYYFYQQPYDQM